jgi:hypothetical protein
MEKPIANIRNRLARPSKKTTLIVALIFGTTVTAFLLGSTFNQDEVGFTSHLSRAYEIPGPSGHAATVSEAMLAADVASATAAASDSLKASTGFAIWNLFTGARTGQSDGDAGEVADIYFERMVIFTAILQIEVGDIDSTVDEIRLVTDEAGGFISGVSTSKSGGGVVTVRVPQVKFYDAIKEIEALGEVEERDLKGEDITDTFVDLEAQLGNLRREEERLAEILDMAVNVEEVLKVEAELNRVRGEIERITGELKYIEGRVELATITVSLLEKFAKQKTLLPQVDWWAPVNSGLNALFTVVQGLVAMAIFLGPFVAVGLPAFYIFKRGNKGKSISSKESPQRE